MTRSRSSDDEISHILDEISHILEHFQSKPEFLAVFPGIPGRTTKRNRRVIVRYKKCVPCLDISYLLFHHSGRILRFRFRVSTTIPYTVECIDSCSQNQIDEGQGLYRIVNDVCRQLSSYSESKKDDISLFYFVSKLMLALDDEAFARRLDRPFRKEEEIFLSEAARRVLDLEVFLLRCAATGPSKTTVCTPVPPGSFWDGNNDGLAANLVLAVTDEALWEFPSAPDQFLNRERRQKLRLQRELLTFLSFLPLTDRGELTIGTDDRKRRIASTTVRLDVRDALGDDPPRFSDLARRRGVMTAYHGTKVQNAWSILNHGLLNLSDTRLCRNGAMMGGGIYVSPSLRVASFFARTQGTVLHPGVFWQWCRKRPNASVPLLDHMPVELLDDYTVTCTAVVESQIIIPPAPASGGEGNGRPPIPKARSEGKYFLVPDPRDVRVTKLHLTFVFRRKMTFPFSVLGTTLILILLFFYIL